MADDPEGDTFEVELTELVSGVEGGRLAEATGASIMTAGGELDLSQLSCRASRVVGLRPE